MKNFILQLVVFFFFLLLSGCGAHIGRMEYTQQFVPDIEKVDSSKLVYVATFLDARDTAGKDSKRIGRLVGGFGETLKSVEVEKPVAIATSDFVCDFLKDAGVTARRIGPEPPDGYTLSGNIKDFHCAFFWMHNANIVIDLTLTDNATGKKVWESSAENHYSGGNIFDKYTILRGDPSIACVGYDCHAKGINAAMNIMLSESIATTWESGGLRDALAGIAR